MATKEESPLENRLEWEGPKPEKKDWRVWGKNLMKRRTTKQLIEDALLMRFKDNKTIQEKVKREFFAKKVKEMLILRTQQRDIIFEKYHASMHAMKLKEQYGIAMQKALRASWHDILGLQFFAEEKDEKIRIKMESMIMHYDKKQTEDFAKNVEEFETKTGFILGGEEPPPAPNAGKKASKLPPPPKKLSKSAIKLVVQTIPDPLDPKLLEEQAKAAKAFILEIKERKLKEFSDKLEVLKKQKQDMLEEEEQKRAIDEEEAKKKSEEDAILQESLGKEEAEKQQLLEEEQKLVQDTWLAQQQEMKDKSRMEYDVIQALEHELYMMYFNDKVDDINNEFNSWQDDIRSKRKRRWQKHYNFCLDIILQFVSMAECVNEYRLEIGKNVPINEWRQWKNLFIRGALLPVILPRPPPPIELPNEKELRIAKEESEDYLDEKGEYTSPFGIEPIGKNKQLGKFLVDVERLAQSLAEPFERPDLSKFSLVVSIVGVPNAGKTILAKHLASSYGILLVEVKQVQELAINGAIIEEEKVKAKLAAQPPLEDGSTPSGKSKEETLLDMLSPKARFGLQAKNAIENKIQVPDGVIANLVVLIMLHPEEYVPRSDEPAAKGAPPSPKKKSVKGAQPPAATTTLVQQTGFMLDGFPQTKGQVAALEKCLTGLDFEAQEAKKEKGSKIAPPPKPDVEPPKESGLTKYLIVESPPEDELLKKLSASTIDPTTNIVYHPLTNPVPPGDKTGIAERLQPLESEEEILAKIAIEAGVFGSMQDLLNKFNNVHLVPQHHDENGIASPNLEEATKTITTFLDDKAKGEVANVTSGTTKAAVDLATEAHREVDVANNMARALAEVFFKSKLVEVEIEQASISDLPPVDAKAPTTKAAPPAKAAPPSKGASTGKTSDAIAKMLDEVTKVVLEIQESAAASSIAAEEAQKHNQVSLDAGSLEEINLCKEEVEKALGVAKEASTKATIAREKCSTLLEAAKALAAGEPPPPPIPPLPTPQVVPPPDPLEPVAKSSPDPELVKKVELAETINKIWEELEKRYLAAIQEGFRLLIHERERTIPLLIEAKRSFVELLKEDNGKQELFEDFQERWNRVELDYRCERKMIKRMFNEGIKFCEILRSLAIERLQGGKQVEQQNLEDLLDERTSTFTSIFTMLVQAELDRHIESCGLLHEHHIGKVGCEFSKQFSCNLSIIRKQTRWTFETPKWLIPLQGSFPEFHMVLSEALANACHLLDVIAGRANKSKKMQPRRQRARRMSGRRNTWMRATNPSFREVTHPDLDVKPVIAHEHQIFYYRLELLARFACKYLSDLQPVCDGAWGHMDAWLMKRCDDESTLVEEIRSVILEAAQESIPLWYRVWMESEFKIEEEEILKIEHIPPEPIIDLTPWHIKVMESIANTFKPFIYGFANTQDVVKLTLSAIDNVYMMWRNAPQNNIYPRLPRYKSRRYGHFQHWANLTHDIIEQSKGESDPRFVNAVEWRGFLITLADAQFDYVISNATIEDIVQARTDFFMVVNTKQPGDPSEGCITLDDFLNTRLWFDTIDDDEDVEDFEDFEDTDSDDPPEETYVLAKSIKTYVFSLLEKSSQGCTKHKPSGLPWQSLLLYLCRDACFETALRKAFTVLANTMSPDEAQLSPEELLQVLYPSGVDGAVETGCITWTIADMEDVLFRAGIEKATPFVEPKTVPSYVSSDSEIHYEKNTIEEFFESRSSSHESQMNANEVGTIEEFLSNVPDTVASSARTLTPWQESEEALQFGPQAPIPEKLTVEDCIQLNATAKLCGALAATFRQHSVLVMQIAPK